MHGLGAWSSSKQSNPARTSLGIECEALLAASETERIVKKAEALFKLMPPNVEEFDHFVPARWLLDNPHILDSDSPAVQASLERAEKVFVAFNSLLS